MTRRVVALVVVAAVCVLLVGALAQHLLAPGDAAPIAIPAVPPRATPMPRRAVVRKPVVVAVRRAVPLVAPDHTAAMMVAVSPTVDAAVVDAVLAREGSPLAGSGRFIVADGRRRGIDPAFLVAFVTYFDVPAPLPPVAHNVGHMRAVAGQLSAGGYRAFPSWQAGIDAWYRLVSRWYVHQWHLSSLDSIVPVYAPGAGRRSVETELNSLRATVDALRRLAQV